MGEALSYAVRLRRMAQLWDETASDGEGDVNAILLADVRRTTIPRASRMMRDAHRAVCLLHRVLERLEHGHLTVEWFEHLLRRVRGLEDDEIDIVDEYVADWDLANISFKRFMRELSILLAWFRKRSETSPPFEKRDVSVEIDPDDDGTACLTVTGPIHEILSLSRRLDLAARAVQRQQRQAVLEGEQIPLRHRRRRRAHRQTDAALEDPLRDPHRHSPRDARRGGRRQPLPHGGGGADDEHARPVRRPPA